MDADLWATVLGLAAALLFAAAPIVATAFTTQGRFFAAAAKHPLRALDHMRAERDTWIVHDDPDPDVAEELDGWDGPYPLELPDGSIRIVFGRPEGMPASMKRFLRHLPRR